VPRAHKIRVTRFSVMGFCGFGHPLHKGVAVLRRIRVIASLAALAAAAALASMTARADQLLALNNAPWGATFCGQPGIPVTSQAFGLDANGSEVFRRAVRRASGSQN
jgi:hypothetical protein